ncbi:MAG: molybdopterin molybdotransferase MoeA [Planctomycetota bacterium]|jgi:molybdenum cofactor synthesis domain-containing protein
MSNIISLDQARDLVMREEVQADKRIVLDLPASHGSRLFEDLRAEGPWPTTDRSAMDGFALAAGSQSYAAGAGFKVIGESLAGHPFQGSLPPDSAIRIMTGAVVPEGADRVLRVEDSNGFDAEELRLGADSVAGANIRPLGSEVAAGSLLMSAGSLIRASEVAALAVLGIHRVPVHRPPRVAILATGDEVVPIEESPAEHQLRDSNSHALAAQVRECGGEALRLGIVGDSQAELSEALARGLEEADLLITIGGVSKGSHDLVHGALSDLGVEQRFHGIALKPGKPTFFGRRPGGEGNGFVFGLPGNPASCVTVFDLLVRPLILRLGGAKGCNSPLLARLQGEGVRKNWRAQAIPCRLSTLADGSLMAETLPFSPSGNPFGMLEASAYALIPGDLDPASLEQVEVCCFSSGWSRGG